MLSHLCLQRDLEDIKKSVLSLKVAMDSLVARIEKIEENARGENYSPQADLVLYVTIVPYDTGFVLGHLVRTTGRGSYAKGKSAHVLFARMSARPAGVSDAATWLNKEIKYALESLRLIPTEGIAICVPEKPPVSLTQKDMETFDIREIICIQDSYWNELQKQAEEKAQSLCLPSQE